MTDRRTTPESMKAREIIANIEAREHPFSTSFTLIGLNPQRVYDRVRHALTPLGIAVSLRGNTLFVGTRLPPREHKLTEMVRRLAMHVDDDALYEEALALIGNI